MQLYLDLIIMILVGLVMLVLGLLIWKTQKIKLIHSYHYKNVKEEDKKEYTKLMGQALSILAISIIVGAIIMYTIGEALSLIVIFCSLLITILILNKAQKKYNGGWF